MTMMKAVGSFSGFPVDSAAVVELLARARGVGRSELLCRVFGLAEYRKGSSWGDGSLRRFSAGRQAEAEFVDWSTRSRSKCDCDIRHSVFRSKHPGIKGPIPTRSLSYRQFGRAVLRLKYVFPQAWHSSPRDHQRILVLGWGCVVCP